ncbi:putative ribonuclease H-like domain-containing protein [Tanacetum coccineum]
MTHPHPNRKFVPQAVLTRSGKINTACASVNNDVRSVNTASSKPTVNHPRPISNAYKKGYSQVIRPFIKATHNRRSSRKKELLTVVLLRVPRKDNIYSVDLQSVVPTKGLTCLFAKAIINESNLWHRRLCHIIVRGNLVRGLPLKIFENDHSCVACQKGKQHKASCKAKLVFFLATKDETSGILKTFITEIENQLDYKVKVIRSDNGTEFKNSVMNQFCEMKGIKREFSVARTPQQNGVAERRNRTLIEAARTMLVDSKLPTTFWAEAVNTACYVLNRVLVIKPHNKTPYELIRGRTPLIDFMKPFGCLVTILNTKDHLGKFEKAADEDFLIGNGPDWLFDVDSLTISMNYVPVVAGNQTNGIAGTRDNIVTGQDEKKIEPEQEYILIPICTTDPLISQDPKVSEENPEEKPTKTDESGASDKDGEDDQATRSEFERLLQQEKQTENPNSTNSINTVSTPISTARTSCIDDDPSTPVNTAEASNAFEENLFERFSPFKNAFTLLPVSNVTLMDDTGIFGNAYDDEDVSAEADLNNLETTMNVSLIPTTRINKDHPKDQITGDFNSAIQTRRMTKISDDHAMICYINRNKKDERGIVVRNKARLATQGYTQEEGIDYDELDVKSAFLYGTIEEDVFIDGQPPGFEDPQFPNKVYKDKGDILLVQVYVDDIIFGSTKKSLCDEFEGLMHKRFQMSSMGELTFFLGLQVQQNKDEIFISQDKFVVEILKKFDFATMKTARTPMEPNKALIKDEEADSVDVHLYRSMIRSLMYLTASRSDIMFAICACVRFQVTPKMSHLHAVKRIFRYLKERT